MIKSVDRSDEFDLLGFEQNVFSARVKACYNAYGTGFKFADFWCQYSGSAVSAVISKLDGFVTVSALGGFDSEELAFFLNAVGCGSVFCSFDCAEKLSLLTLQSGTVMKKACSKVKTSAGGEIDYKSVYSLLNERFDNIGEYDLWFPDMSHRIRHGCAEVATKYEDGLLVSCAAKMFKTQDECIIGCVATKKEYVGRGYASGLVRGLTENFDGTAYLCREENKNESLYKKLGFENSGVWAVGRIK